MMNSGKYYVGDLCYVFSDEEWEKVCALIIDGHTCKEGEFQLEDGRQFAIYNTAYGDGRYYDEQGRSYSVDSGSIGCILFDDVQCSVPFLSGGQIIDFDKDFRTSVEDGKIQIGKILIDTDPDYDEEDEYEDWEDWEN